MFRNFIVLRISLLALLIAIDSAQGATERVLCQVNLAQYGFNFDEHSPVADYSGLTFLSEDMLLVSIVQRQFHSGAQSMFVDSPSSTLLLVDTNQGRVISLADMPIEKWWGAIQFAAGGQFVLWNRSGIQICGSNFKCGSPINGQELRLVSPRGTTAVVLNHRNEVRDDIGSWGELDVLDVQQTKIVAMFPCRLPDRSFEEIVPGDGVLLISNLINTFLRQPGKQDQRVQFNGKGTFADSRFLGPQTFAYFDWDASQAVIATLGPRELYRLPVQRVWRSGFLTTYKGTRFGLYEHGYTRLNTLLNFLDIDEGRPENFQRVRVFDTSSPNEIAQFNWDPRPHLVKPALSLNGRRLARIRGAVLEVLSVP